MMGCVPSSKLLFRFLALLAAVYFCAAASAQTFRGTILGTVTDSSGASVAASRRDLVREDRYKRASAANLC